MSSLGDMINKKIMEAQAAGAGGAGTPGQAAPASPRPVQGKGQSLGMLPGADESALMQEALLRKAQALGGASNGLV